MKITDPDTVETSRKMIALIDEGYTFAHAWHVLSKELPPATQVVVSFNYSDWLKAVGLLLCEENVIAAMREIAA